MVFSVNAMSFAFLGEKVKATISVVELKVLWTLILDYSPKVNFLLTGSSMFI